MWERNTNCHPYATLPWNHAVNAKTPRNLAAPRNHVVEMAGIEPASGNQPRVLLRVQSALHFSALGITQTSYQIGSVN